MQDKVASTVRELFQRKAAISERVINIDPKKPVEGGVQSDIRFVQDLYGVAAHSKTTDKKVFYKRAHFSKDEYQFIEETGQRHYKANLFNTTCHMNAGEISEGDKCKCGCGRAKGERLPYCLDEEKGLFFGQGVILFFFYTKKMMLLIFLTILVYGIFSLVTNLISDDTNQNCREPGILGFMCPLKVKGEIQNKQNEPRFILAQLWLGFAFCLMWSVAVRLIKRLGRRKGQQIDNELETSSSEVIFITKLPIGEYHEGDLLAFMNKLWDLIEEEKGRLRIKSVQIIYDMRGVRTKIQQIKEIASKMKKILHKSNRHEKGVEKTSYLVAEAKEEEYKGLKQQIATKYQEIYDFREKFLADEQFRRQYSSECALVHFASNEDQTIFLEEYGEFKSSIVKVYIDKIKRKLFPKDPTCLFKERAVRIYKAPEPSDIFWQHCEKKCRLRRTMLVWLINLVLSLISFGFLYLFRAITKAHPDMPSLSIVSIIAVNLFNRLIWHILLKVIFIEENYSKTINIMSVMDKSYASQLINIILIPLILNTSDGDTINGPTGLAGSAHDFQVTSFIFMTVFNLVNVPHRIRQLIKCIPFLRRAAIRYYSRVSGEFDRYDEIKDVMGKLYDPPLVPVAGFYVYITSIVGQAYFFCHLQPILIMYLLGNVFLFHLMNRHLVFRVGKIPDLLDINIFETVTGLALNIPLLYAISSVVFLKLNGDAENFGYYVPSILCFLVWFMSVESPINIYSWLITWITNTFFKIRTAREQRRDNSNAKTDNPETNQDLNPESMENVNPAEEEQTMKVIKRNRARNYRSHRKENYYIGIGTNDLFNFESKLVEAEGNYHGKVRDFCERFTLNMGEEEEMIANPGQASK